MKKITFLLLMLTASWAIAAQEVVQPVNEVDFFTSDEILHVNLTVNMRTMMRKKEGVSYPAAITVKMHDGTLVTETVRLEVRGKYRKENCYLPPLKVSFKQPGAKVFSPLGSLKLVNVCDVGRKDYTEFLLKEYITYKLYNIITDQSFRVRLLHITFTDSAKNKKMFEEYGFLIEDVKDMARRNGCVERKRPVTHTEATERKGMTRVALFEYMIANSDWSVPARHNMRLIVSREDTNGIPVAVPYDFDHSGFVKTDYALPPPALPINDVTERHYRGFARSMEEISESCTLFLSRKDSMIAVVNNFELLSKNTRKEMVRFLNDFFAILAEPKEMRSQFILNARKN